MRGYGAQHVGQQQVHGALVQAQLGAPQPGAHVAARGQAQAGAARAPPEGAAAALHRARVQRRHRLQELHAVLSAQVHGYRRFNVIIETYIYAEHYITVN